MKALNKLVAIALPALLLAGCELGSKEQEQVGFRGTAMVQISDPDSKAKVGDIPAPPYELTAEMIAGDRASTAYENVPVLGNVSVDEFNYLMQAMTTWVAPDGSNIKDAGCTYCHNPENMASDEKYTKVVARKMLQMTQNINATWAPHFSKQDNAGVTCWTCHRGNPVPVNNWSTAVPDPGTITGNKRGGNTPAQTVAYASLNSDPFTDYLAGKDNIRVGGKEFPTAASKAAIQTTEKTYGLMMHMSQGLGVNCTFCHNSNNFAKWEDSRPQRVTAWYGIRMVRDINNNYITALGDVWPANGKGAYGNRRGPHGDPLKVNCATCHQGVNKPLGGAKMLKDYPALKGAAPVAAPAPVVAAAPAPADTAAAAEAVKPAA
ncbi:photosynthetic reaction center cytochrome PufC [Sandarakinorhabdus sp.]|uniref:photosynthetic reaction center cytochrome PufC n=1 Tax=Sandarakinorhabdus sp. TaxID=1916663 RepID=UPI0028A6C677|nr:photosynthetic reaction center cytochrome PufC [Sandarakinorhabdus sp.]